MVGVVFHHVITFEDPHEYSAAIKLTCGSSDMTSRIGGQHNKQHSTFTQSIIHYESEATGSDRDLHSNQDFKRDVLDIMARMIDRQARIKLD